MASFGAGATMLVAFWLALPHADGSPSLVARNEHVTSAFVVPLVGLLLGGIALIFTAVVG